MIIITFNNSNSRTSTRIDIYREPYGTDIPDVPINPPIAKLDGFATQYIDNDTVLGQDYNYRFRVYKQGGESIMSEVVVLGDVSLYGPGNYLISNNGSSVIWDMGTLIENDLLPNASDLAAISGEGSTFVNWTGRWRKFKVGNAIYFTPYKGAIKIETSQIPAFISRLYNQRLISKSYCSYEFITTLEQSTALAVLDGRYPTLWNLDKEYPRKNALDPFFTNQQNVSMIYAVGSETTAQILKQVSLPYRQCTAGNINLTTYSLYDWCWKPIIKFIPKNERNY